MQIGSRIYSTCHEYCTWWTQSYNKYANRDNNRRIPWPSIADTDNSIKFMSILQHNISIWNLCSEKDIFMYNNTLHRQRDRSGKTRDKTLTFYKRKTLETCIPTPLSKTKSLPPGKMQGHTSKKIWHCVNWILYLNKNLRKCWYIYKIHTSIIFT